MIGSPTIYLQMRALMLSLGLTALVLTGCGATSQSVQAEGQESMGFKTYSIPDAVKDSPWNAQVGNLTIPIERRGGVEYARFQGAGEEPARVTLTLTGKQSADFKIAPAATRTEQHGNSVIVDLPADQHVRVVASRGGNALMPLFLFREQDSFSPFKGSGRQRPRINIVAPPAGTDPAHHTAKIQQLLDQAAADEGSALIVRAGVHPIKGLVFKNDVTIYFEPGAIWKAVSDTRQWNSVDGNPVLLNMQGAKNITLAGYGVIDAWQDEPAQNHPGTTPILVNIRDAQNIRLQNLILRGITDFQVHTSKQVMLDHLHLISNSGGSIPKATPDVELTNLVLMQ